MDGSGAAVIVLEILGAWLLLGVLTVAALNAAKAAVRRHYERRTVA